MPASYENLPIDETFARNYEIEWLIDLPNSPRLRRYFIDRTPHSDGAGPILRITAGDQKFIIVVGGRLQDLKVATWPDPFCLFAIPSDVLVDVRHPELTGQIGTAPWYVKTYLYPVPESGLMIASRGQSIFCYGGDGLVWSSDLSRSAEILCHCGGFHFDVSGGRLIIAAHIHSAQQPGDEVPTEKILDLLTGQPM